MFVLLPGMSVQKSKESTTSPPEQDTEVVKVCSTVWEDGQSEYIAYMSIFDDSVVVTAGVEPLPPSWESRDARKRGIQQSVSHTLDVVAPDALQVYDHEIDEAGLVLGRLPPHHRETVGETDVSFVDSNTMYEKILRGLASFSTRQAPWTHKGNLSSPIKNHAYVYTDGSHIHSNGDSAVGYVITDTTGQIYEFGSKPLSEETARPIVAEFEAIKHGIEKANRRDDIKTITVFTDCMDAVRALNSLGQNQAVPNEATEYPWKIGLAASAFRTVGVSYVNREENTLADALAKRGQMASFHLLSP